MGRKPDTGKMMKMEEKRMPRKQALEELKKFGISGKEVYFIDIIPLIEMIWADGQVQRGEISIFNDFLPKHVERLNDLAGYEAFHLKDAHKFVSRFFKEKPGPELLKTLRNLSAAAGITGARHDCASTLKDSLLCACLDIAASSTVKYPYGLHDRFDPAEKSCFFEILDTLEGRKAGSIP